MATLGTNVVTYLDFAKRLDESSKVERTIIELLNQTNEILDDMAVIEGNLPTGHKTTIRTGLPTATWRMLNYGVMPSKSATAQVTDTCGMLEAYAQVDKSLADLNGNSAAWRLSEEKAYVEVMNQNMAYTLFYGDTGTNPERFLGLAPRYNASTGSASAANVIKAGGSGADNTSVWLVVWGPETVHAIYPKGSKAGIVFEDKGQQTLSDEAGGMYEGYRSHYKWDLGLTVRDWRYVVRICNIDVSDLNDAIQNDTAHKLITLMTMAKNKVPNLRAGKAAWYMNQDVKTALEVLYEKKATYSISMDYLENGQQVTRFKGIPVRRCDQIINAETLVV